MTTLPQREPRYSKEEYKRRGEALYENSIRAQIEPQHNNKFVAIAIETGDYEVDEDDYTAGERLLTRHPDAQMWLMRAGHATAYTTGIRRTVKRSNNFLPQGVS